MEEIQNKWIHGIHLEDLGTRKEEIKTYLVKRDLHEDLVWKQKPWIHWLREDNKNTKFFHHSLLQTRR